MSMGCRKTFRVYEKHGFACAYCGERPGRSQLQTDHLIPKSRGGSDNEMNLVPACVACNQGKSNKFYVPHSMRLLTDDDGYHVIAACGVWAVKVGEGGAYVSGAVYHSNSLARSCDCYEFDLDRCWEGRWIDHVEEKTWSIPHRLSDFVSMLSLSRKLIACPFSDVVWAAGRSDDRRLSVFAECGLV